MKEKINWKSIVAGMASLLLGIGLILLDLFKLHTITNLWISIGCSLIASGVVIVLTDLFVDRIVENPLDVWGIKRIYPSRTKLNDDCEISMKKAKYQVDIVAFGLYSYRMKQEKLTKSLLQKGVNFRIITMAPDSNHIPEREKEEIGTENQIKNTIEQLIQWANKLNQQSSKGKIIIKGYTCMTLDYYWRVDNDVYIGPYWYGINSQETISYKFVEGKGLDMYSDYFDSLWNNTTIMKPLTDITDFVPKTSRKKGV